MYIKAPDQQHPNLANTSETANSTITLNKEAYPIFQNDTWPLNNPITADNIYQYTVNSTNGGQGTPFTVIVNAFQDTPNDGTLNPY
jgi:hypothetical protein